jgi:hypothetical protein
MQLIFNYLNYLIAELFLIVDLIQKSTKKALQK